MLYDNLYNSYNVYNICILYESLQPHHGNLIVAACTQYVKKGPQKCQLTITLELLLLEFPLYDLLTTPHVTTTQSNVFNMAKTHPPIGK